MTILLPGYSRKNKAELDLISGFLQQQGMEVSPFSWRHWEDTRIDFVPDHQADDVWLTVAHRKEKTINVVAKSIGTLVAMLLVGKHPHAKWGKIILMGIPMGTLDELQMAYYKQIISKHAEQVTVIQNEFDKHASFAQVEALLDGIPTTLIKKEGNSTHEYPYAEDVHRILSDA